MTLLAGERTWAFVGGFVGGAAVAYLMVWSTGRLIDPSKWRHKPPLIPHPWRRT